MSNATRRRKQQPCLKAESVVGVQRHARKEGFLRWACATLLCELWSQPRATTRGGFHCPCRRAHSLLVSSPIPCRPPLIFPKASSRPLSHRPVSPAPLAQLVLLSTVRGGWRRPLQPQNGERERERVLAIIPWNHDPF